MERYLPESGVIIIFFKLRFKKKTERNIRNEIIIFIASLAVLSVAFFGVVRYMVVRSSPLRSKVDRQVRDLHFSLKMDSAVYHADEKVMLKLGVTNTSNQPINIEFPSSMECDFIVEKEMDLFFVKIPFIVWKYSAKVGEVDTGHTITIPPGKETIFKAQWDQTDVNGKPVKPGKYRITGIMNTKKFKISLQLRGATE